MRDKLIAWGLILYGLLLLAMAVCSAFE